MSRVLRGIRLLKKCFLGPVQEKLFVAIAATILIGSPYLLGQTLTTIYNFGARPGDGAFPQPGVIFDKAGNLYGNASIGGIGGSNGILFELTPPAQLGDPWTEIVLHKFRGNPDGKTPESRPLLTNGRIFGTTWAGGTHDMGTAFAWAPSPDGSNSEKVLYSFGSFPGDGINPNAGLLAGSGGAFFGVTQSGGANGRGTVFQLTPPGTPRGKWTETILHSFTAAGDAAFPSSELIVDQNGNLYGTTLLGGAQNLGAVFEVSPPVVPGDPWTEKVLYSFHGADGSSPGGRLLLDGSGALYGTSSGGGTRSAGTVFKLTPSGGSWTETVLYNFSGGSPDGGSPFAGVIMDNQGRLLGTAQNGGQGGGGVVFMLEPPQGSGEWIETVLHSFSGPDGYSPSCTLVLRGGGIYGTTTQGGQFGTGTAFVLTP
jgi:uncharacterized repeat protein (TIGR03803 family)